MLAFLERREELWTKGWLQAEVQRRASDPRERLLAIFDVFGEWFQEDDFEGCSFINVMLETPDRADPSTAPAPPTWPASATSSRAWRARPASPTPRGSRASGTSS